MSCCTLFKIHNVYSVCYVITDLRSLTITCNIYKHMCYKCLACESKMASILMEGNSGGCPLNCPLFHYLKVAGCPMSCPLFPYMEVVGSLICMAKFPWAAHSAAHFLIFGSSGLPTELPIKLPTVSIYGSSGQPNFAWQNSYGQPKGSPLRCPLFNIWKKWAAYWASHCFHIWK